LKRLGILGGTFDPVHLGHLRTAEEIGQELNLEKVYLIPCASPPHKSRQPVTSYDHRLAMVRLATEDAPLLEASNLEGRRPGPSYSIETLREFYSIFKPNPELFFILGIEAFLEVKTWKRYQTLFDYAHFVIIHRAGYSEEKLEPLISDLGAEIKKDLKGDGFIMPSGKMLMFKDTTLMDISSTCVRKMIAEGMSIRFLVPGSVGDYITREGLYAEYRQHR
jgi:nicotinate-nucleotide adenylyltransferase